MKGATPNPEELVVHDLTLRLQEAVETLAAIRSGAVDALVVASPEGRGQVFVLKGADHAHQVLLETLNEGALTITADATVLYANRRFAELIGRPLERVLGVPLSAFVTPADADAFAALLAGAARGRSKGELALRAAGGSRVPVMASMNAVVGIDDPHAHETYTVVMTDLTPLKDADRALRKANDALEARVTARTAELSRANEALRAEIAERTRLEGELRQKASALIDADQRKDEFLSMLGHELRNPLAPILTATEMMRGLAVDQPKLERYRGVIERQVRNLTRLVDDLLDVARITRGAIVLRREVVDLTGLVRSAVEVARPLIDGGGHALRVTVPTRSVRLFVDPTRVEQALVNVLNNAAKYTGHGGRIELSAEERGGEAIVRVRDNGAGISAELLPRIFDLFVQGDRTLDRAQGGLGIGLTLVRSLVEMHGGRVEAHSGGLGRGSEFVLRLPVAADARATAPPDAEAGAEGDAPESRRVLVVEDNPDAAQTLVELLTQWGHDVRLAGGAEDAIRVAETFHPQTALIDVGLPEVDGYEVARRLRRSACTPPEGLVLIGVTGYGQEQDRSRGREAGFDHHLVKPADPETLRILLGRRDDDGSPA